MTRIAIFGDIGGHAENFAEHLKRLGVDVAAGLVPDDLVVVQVGDLVDGGPDSVGVLEMVARFLANSPEQWVQLVGNHELNHVRDEPTFIYVRDARPLPETAVPLLKALYDRGEFRNAVALELDSIGPTLVTHAGLTAHLWDELGAPTDVVEVARLLNEHDHLMDRTGVRLTGRGTTFDVGPAWADAERELHASWRFREGLHDDVPFSQVFGHTDLEQPIVQIAGRTFRTVDNGLGRYAGHRLRPFVTTGRVLGVDPRSVEQARTLP
ncbi:MAG: metallophosphoesterase [Acidimicrobiia bacterium]